VCEGAIAHAPAGAGGFGYDPVFLLPERGLTLAQLAPEEKHRISHRGQALRLIAPAVRGALDSYS
jgi:XTP/dITP diphosphohydrolase